MERQRSLPALWCQRLALFLVLYFTVVVAGQRWGLIETPSVFWLLGLGAGLLVFTLALGGIGLHQLWQYGHKGGMRSIRGIILAGLMLIPFAWYGWLSLTLPPLHDITTDRLEPPAFEAALALRAGGMNEIGDLSEDELRLQAIAYPQVVSRRYLASADRVYASVRRLIANHGWKVLAEDIPETIDKIDIEDSASEDAARKSATTPVARPDETATSDIADAEAEISESSTRKEDEENVSYIEFVATSMIMAFPSDIVIRIIGEEEGSLVDMRSSSRWGPHDLGSNAARITKFLGELDIALAGVAGENADDGQQ